MADQVNIDLQPLVTEEEEVVARPSCCAKRRGLIIFVFVMIGFGVFVTTPVWVLLGPLLHPALNGTMV